MITKSKLEYLRREYPIGTRVRLVSMRDPQAPPPGTIGVVTGVDDAGNVMTNWSNGSGLSVIPGVDRIEKAGKDDD